MATTTKKTRRTRKKAPEKIDGPQELPPPPSEPKDSTVRKAMKKEPDPRLAGIDFDGDSPVADPRSNDPIPVPNKRTEESNRANQEAARKAIAQMQSQPIRRVHQPARPTAPDPVVQAEIAPRMFRVLQPAKITRGAASYNLPAGKVITNRDYDVESLRQQGVQLEEMERPAAS